MNQRLESLERWAKYVKDNDGKWKEIHTEFIDSQFKKAESFIKRLAKEKNGPEKIIKLYNIKNKKGYPSLLKRHQ